MGVRARTGSRVAKIATERGIVDVIGSDDAVMSHIKFVKDNAGKSGERSREMERELEALATAVETGDVDPGQFMLQTTRRIARAFLIMAGWLSSAAVEKTEGGA